MLTSVRHKHADAAAAYQERIRRPTSTVTRITPNDLYLSDYTFQDQSYDILLQPAQLSGPTPL